MDGRNHPDFFDKFAVAIFLCVAGILVGYLGKLSLNHKIPFKS